MTNALKQATLSDETKSPVLTTVGQFLSFSKNLWDWFEKINQNGFGSGSNLFIYFKFCFWFVVQFFNTKKFLVRFLVPVLKFRPGSILVLKIRLSSIPIMGKPDWG
jgi:hypothetical protein